MTDPAALLRELAIPRLVGTPNHARVREILKRELAARGFSIDEQAFTATASRLQAVALVGAALACGAIGAVLLRFIPHHPMVAFGWMMTVFALVVHLLLTAGARDPGTAMVQCVNLIGRRRDRPAIWLAAHYDSKGQPISMATRLVAVGLCLLGAVGLLAILAIDGGLIAPPPPPNVVVLAAPALVGGLLLALNRVTNDSPGAVDNASALAAIFAILDQVPGRSEVGVLFPDAEELGLIGSRALLAERSALLEDTAVVNFDGIDDAGRPVAVLHRPGPLVEAVGAALGAERQRWLPVVVDGMQLARGARECVTVMQGNWSTARIVHTPRDTADRLTLEGVRQVATGVARVLSAS